MVLLALARAYAATDQFDRVVPLLRNYGLPEQLQRDSVTTTEIEAGIVLADALHQSGEAGQALEIAERGRARAFIELMATNFKDNPPAREAVAVVGLPANVQVEISCIATE